MMRNAKVKIEKAAEAEGGVSTPVKARTTRNASSTSKDPKPQKRPAEPKPKAAKKQRIAKEKEAEDKGAKSKVPKTVPEEYEEELAEKAAEHLEKDTMAEDQEKATAPEEVLIEEAKMQITKSGKGKGTGTQEAPKSYVKGSGKAPAEAPAPEKKHEFQAPGKGSGKAPAWNDGVKKMEKVLEVDAAAHISEASFLLQTQALQRHGGVRRSLRIGQLSKALLRRIRRLQCLLPWTSTVSPWPRRRSWLRAAIWPMPAPGCRTGTEER